MTPDQLRQDADRREALAKAATPGPWRQVPARRCEDDHRARQFVVEFPDREVGRIVGWQNAVKFTCITKWGKNRQSVLVRAWIDLRADVAGVHEAMMGTKPRSDQ